MESRLEPDSLAASPRHPNKVPKGAGELSMPRPGEAKDGEHPVCFELMGMGDLEVVDVVEVANHQAMPSRPPPGAAKPCTAWAAEAPERAAPPPKKDAPFMSFCSADWAPSEDSSDEDDEDGLGARTQDAPDASARGEDGDGRAAGEAAVRSKLSVSKVVQVCILPASPEVRAQVHQDDGDVFANIGGELVDVEGDGFSEDDDGGDGESRGAPTPDNTPDHTPSEENQPGGLLLGLDAGATLYSTLKGMALSGTRNRASAEASGTPSPAGSPETSPGGTLASACMPTTSTGSGGSTLGRVWSIILGRAGRRQGSPPPAPPHLSDEEDDSGDDDDALYVDPQTIEELEATLEEVRLDGDGDDPVVSYLVEEAEDAARAPGAACRDVTVEEVHEDDDVEHQDAVEGLEDDEGAERRAAPAPRASGLLSRIFSRSKTSQDITKAEAEQPASARRPERGAAAKRAGKGDPDRLLHLHPHRQANKVATNKVAMRSSLSRILGRWLRQGQGKTAVWGVGAEGDTGDSGVSAMGVMTSRRSAVPQQQQQQLPPAVQCVRRATASTPSQPLHATPGHDKYSQNDCSVGAKLSADFGSQTEESHLSRSSSQQSQRGSLPVGKVLKETDVFFI